MTEATFAHADLQDIPGLRDMLVAPIQNAADATQRAKADTLLSPRFYTTDYEAMNRLDVSPVRAEWDVMMAEYEGDNNHDHFQRDASFRDENKQLPPELQQQFLDFLVGSITSEFSGCVLYNEIRKNVSNPDIKQLMTFMARDESRHAGFINSALKDYGLGVDLGLLRKDKKYTYGLLLRGDDLGQKLKISGIPVVIVLDGNGKIIKRIGGYDAKLFDNLSTLIDKELETMKK